MTDDVKQSENRPNNARILIILIIAVVFIALIITAMVYAFPSGSAQHGNAPVTLNISGSTTIQPVSESLANAYMQLHPDVRITVEGGGSGAGIVKAGTGSTDIGSSSRNLNPAEMKKYPDLQTYMIGGSAVVVIVNHNNPVNEAARSELQILYDNKQEDISNLTHLNSIRTVVRRSDDSGTEQTFAQWLDPRLSNVSAIMNVTDTAGTEHVTPLAVTGNEGVVQTVAKMSNAIGFADFGFAERDPGVKILKLRENSTDPALPVSITIARESIRQELSRADQNNTYYISGLTRPLLYITKGPPTRLENDFINFARAPDKEKYFDDVGYFSINEFTNSSK